MSEWISVKDRLPKPLRDVFVFGDDETGGDVYRGYMGREKGWYCEETGREFDGVITHWMPIVNPKPPTKQNIDKQDEIIAYFITNGVGGVKHFYPITEEGRKASMIDKCIRLNISYKSLPVYLPFYVSQSDDISLG